MNNEPLKLPEGFVELTDRQRLIEIYRNIITSNKKGQSHSNPLVSGDIVEVFGTELKQLWPIVNKTANSAILLLQGVQKKGGIRVKKAGGTYNFSLAKVLRSLGIKVPKGYLIEVPVKVERTAELGAYLFLDFQHREEVVAPKPETQAAAGQQKPEGGKAPKGKSKQG